ncbi:MAG: TlpA disulfide reductase family protein [Arenicellales bacterium]
MPETLNASMLVSFIRLAAFVASLAAATWVASYIARRLGLDPRGARRTVIVGTVTGVLAARLAYVALYWQAFSAVPWTAAYLWRPGYLPVAGLAAGALYVLFRLRNMDTRHLHVRAVTGGLAAGAILLTVVLLATSHLPGQLVLRAGDKVPDFTLRDLDGDKAALSDLEGKGVVLNFWATWCPPCRDEMPLLEAAWAAYRTRNVVIVGIALDQPADVVRPFIDSRGISYPIWTDPGHDAVDSNAIFDWFDSAGVPTTVFIRPDGTIDSIHVGELRRSLLVKRLAELVPK